jgi:hypothetical protein
MAEMSEREPATLECLARQQDRMLTEHASLRDNLNVLIAIEPRLENSALLAEIRATHSLVSRHGEELRRLEPFGTRTQSNEHRQHKRDRGEPSRAGAARRR